MGLKFTKMHGLGNDYIYVSLFEETVQNAPKLSRALSDRHRGVGSDGLILVGPATVVDAHVRMEMYNADGSRSQMCGNGIRCVAKFAYERGYARQNPMRVETDRGVLSLQLTVESEIVTQVRVDMGEPILDPKKIPVALAGERVVATPFPLPETILAVTCVSMGNPHAVIYVPAVRETPLSQWGPLVERHPLFPERINAHFVQVLDPEHVHMITWERGTGPTQACGTGACAVCVAGVLCNVTRRAITVQLPGGYLQCEWDEATNHVFKTGPATEVFRGELVDERVR